MTATHMTEDQAVNLVRNALLASGHEMGKDGDHWPVIKATAFSIMKDYEDWKISQNVFAEVKQHYKDMVGELQELAKRCPEESKPKVNAIITDLLELYGACFTPIDRHDLHVTDEDYAPHIRRAEEIIKALEEDNG